MPNLHTKEHTFRNGFTITDTFLDAHEEEGRSEEEIAAICGVSRMALYNARKRMNHPQKARSDKGVEKVDAEAKREQRNAYMRRYQRGRKKYKGMLHPKTGQHVLVHRYVAEVKLGRPLRDDEVVHHIDGDIHNNTPENLTVFASQAEHMEHHQQDDSFRRGKKYTIGGKVHTLREWARISGVHYDTISSRLYRGWEPAKAIFTPPNAM